MLSRDWSYYYNLLHEHYSQLEIDGYITEGEMEDCLDVIHDSTLGELQEECVKLELITVPSLSYADSYC